MAPAVAAAANWSEVPSTDMASPLSVVCKFWTELDLENMRTKLDEVGLKIAEHQEESMQNRKRLAEATREFRRTAGEAATSKAVGSLLKQYQEEIDRLTKRAKHGETAYLDVYQKLYEAPDPAPALSIALETASRTADLEAQCRKLSQELAEYKAESTQIKNQDLTIRKLEERIRQLEAQIEEKEAEVEEVKVQAVAEANAARLASMQQRESELTAMLAEAQASLAAMQKLYTSTQNQLFAIQSQTEEERVSRQTELELASAELERAQERLSALEREKTKLVTKLSGAMDSSERAANGGGPGSGGGAAGVVPTGGGARVEETLRQELSTQREMAARLRLEVSALRRELDESNSMWEARIEGMRGTLLATEQHARALEDELSTRPTLHQVEELRQQIRVLQALTSLDLGDAGAEDGSGAAARAGVGIAAPGPGSLEALLLQKNRHLEHELTMCRLHVVDIKQELDTALANIASLEAQVEEKQQLINQLEEDLLASRAANGPRKAGASDAAAGSSGSNKLTGLLGNRAGEDSGDQEEEAGSSSMVRVLCNQRDRFRHKAVELEEELTRVRAELAAAKSEAAAAKADNIALVERLRYVHGFKQQQRQPGAEGDVEVGLEVERKYARLYDDGINPFKEFQGQQRDRQKKQMGVADRFMYMFGQLVFGSKSARLFTFLYLVAMHLLVFASLLRMTHHHSSQLYEHQMAILDQRHDVAAMMHHEIAAPGAGMPLEPPPSRLP